MIGTTRSRVSVFMNKFRKMGLIHGVQSGTLRRIQAVGGWSPPGFSSIVAPGILATIAVIAVLAVAKPI